MIEVGTGCHLTFPATISRIMSEISSIFPRQDEMVDWVQKISFSSELVLNYFGSLTEWFLNAVHFQSFPHKGRISLITLKYSRLRIYTCNLQEMVKD